MPPVPDLPQMETLQAAMERLRAQGYTEDLQEGDGGLRCSACGTLLPIEDLTVDEVVRFEGMSNPDDQDILFALSGSCGHLGLYHAAFGPAASPEEAAMMIALHRRDPARPSPGQ